MNQRILVYLAALVMALFPLSGMTETFNAKSLSFFTINSAITPATMDYLSTHFKRVDKSAMIVIRINTPGGLVTTTKDIITLIGRQDNPVAVWITPEGASAASAGSIIASSAHFIFMSPGTSLGAATPVGLGEDLKESDGRRKAMNDLKSLVRALSVERNRPASPFEDMIEKASSFTDKEARDLHIAEILPNENDIKSILQNRIFKFKGKETTLLFAESITNNEVDPTPGQKLLEVLSHPTTAYFIFLIAVALIYFEFQAPGGYVAGSIGTCLLVISGIAFQVLPLDWGAFSLILIGIVLLIIELYVTSYGMLFLTGLAFFVIGSLFLFQDQSGFISIHYSMIYSSLAGVLISMGGVVWYLWKEKKKTGPTPDFFLPENARGVVMAMNNGIYQVKVRGEIWNAVSEEPLQINEEVLVLKVLTDRLQIEIKKIPST